MHVPVRLPHLGDPLPRNKVQSLLYSIQSTVAKKIVEESPGVNLPRVLCDPRVVGQVGYFCVSKV